MKSNFHFKKLLHSALIIAIGIISPVAGMAVSLNETELANRDVMAHEAKTMQVIKVKPQSQSQPSVNVASPAFSSDSAGCAALKPAPDKAVQGQPVVNLNQPASCFKLMMGSLPDTQKISIAARSPLKSSVVVAAWPVQIFQPNKFHSVPVSPAKSIPVLVYGFTAAIMLYLGIKIADRKINPELFALLSARNNLFVVMRC